MIRRRPLAAVTLVALMASTASSFSDDRPAALQPGSPMPRLEGDLLSGGRAVLPDAARGKVTFLALGFSYDSRFAVEKWGKWFRDQRGSRPDVAFYEVPMMGRAARLGRFFIDRGMRGGTPKELHGNVITVYGDTGPWKTRLGVSDRTEKDAYLLLVDKQGVVRWMHHGPFDEARAAELVAALDQLSSTQPGAATQILSVALGGEP
jgi:hypothetical protein